MKNKLNQILSGSITTLIAISTLIILAAASLSMVTACSKIQDSKIQDSKVKNSKPQQKKNKNQNESKTQVAKTGKAMANPATVKCLKDGYVLEPIIENGVPKGYMCVNPKTGKKCEQWDYFHKKCQLN